MYKLDTFKVEKNIYTNYKTIHGEYYTANVCYGALSNPAYFDYMHLVF
jgi:hypothetical protein